MGVKLSKQELEAREEGERAAAAKPVDLNLLTQISRADVCDYFNKTGHGSVWYSERSCDVRLRPTSGRPKWEFSDIFEEDISTNRLLLKNSVCTYGAFSVDYDGVTSLCCYEQRGGIIVGLRILSWCDDTANEVSHILGLGYQSRPAPAPRLELVAIENVRVCRISAMQYMHFTIHAIAGWFLYNRAVLKFDDTALCALLHSISSSRKSAIGEERSIIEFVTSVNYRDATPLSSQM